MSQENVELAKKAFGAIGRRDLDGLLALMDQEVESVSRTAAIEGGLHGHEGIRRWWETWFETFPDYSMEIVQVRDLGNVALTTIRAVGHGAGSNVPLTDRFWHATRWRDGKCLWWQTFYSEAEALEVVGVSE